jgi:uncharacterized protein (DUF2384 family)
MRRQSKPGDGRGATATIEDVSDDAATALRAFFRLADDWHLTIEEQRTLLGMPARTTFYRWRHGEHGALSVDLVERLSHLLAIYGALHRIYLEHDRADDWIRRPNTAPPFGGRPPIERLLDGRNADLYVVRRHLESIAGPAI